MTLNTDLSQRSIKVYTDGGVRNHGNYAGGHVKKTDISAWAYLIFFDNNHNYSKTNYNYGATNNQMELTAVKEALEWLVINKYKNNYIQVISDSRYIVDAINKKWLNNWVVKNWKSSGNKSIKNVSLWKQIFSLINQFSNLSFKWTKGHANDYGNEFVDNLLNKTMDEN